MPFSCGEPMISGIHHTNPASIRVRHQFSSSSAQIHPRPQSQCLVHTTLRPFSLTIPFLFNTHFTSFFPLLYSIYTIIRSFLVPPSHLTSPLPGHIHTWYPIPESLPLNTWGSLTPTVQPYTRHTTRITSVSNKARTLSGVTARCRCSIQAPLPRPTSSIITLHERVPLTARLSNEPAKRYFLEISSMSLYFLLSFFDMLLQFPLFRPCPVLGKRLLPLIHTVTSNITSQSQC